ncbi:MAG TPA: hypothetical protein VGS79_23215 [Puia sp.]|nr:hypothetical protein [Puia sp.]
MHRTAGLLFIGVFLTVVLRAQDTLPRFTATARGPGKILISWHNKYPVVSQISIQRSTDSLRDFTTLITVPDPHLPENGAVDNKAPHPNFYYRLFIVLDNGKYLFTHSERPRANTGQTPAAVAADKADNADNADNPIVRPEDTRVMFITPADSRSKSTLKLPSSIHGSPGLAIASSIFVRRGDTMLGKLSGKAIEAFRDSVLRHSKDTIIFVNGDTLLIKPFVPKEIYKVSPFVFTGKYGNIHIALPEAPKRHYAVKFFDENNKLLFELSEIKDPSLILDKTNFLHAGWFHFELYDGDQLKEKNRFFIPKEF